MRCAHSCAYIYTKMYMYICIYIYVSHLQTFIKFSQKWDEDAATAVLFVGIS